MIGTWGFVEELSFVVFPVFLLFLVAIGVRRTPPAAGGYSSKGTVLLILLLLLPTVLGWRFAREVQVHHFLTSLTTEAVESFTIGPQQVSDEKRKSLLVHALNEVQWFSSQHGGWAQPVDLRIRLRSGEEKSFRIATYLRELGVVIDFAAKNARGLHTGYGFSEALPTALEQIGTDLPH